MTGLRVGYVLGTTSGGTGRHVAMLAAGCLSAGLSVIALGPEETRSLFAAGAGAGTWVPAVASGSSARASAALAGTCPSAVAAFERVQIGDRPRPVRDAAAVWRLRRLLAQASLDIVHAHGLRAAALTALAMRPAPLARWHASRTPALLVTVHNAPPTASGTAAIYGLLERLVARRADAVLCVSADLSARMRRLGARDVGLAVVPAPGHVPLTRDVSGLIRDLGGDTDHVAAGTYGAARHGGTWTDEAATSGEARELLRAELGSAGRPVVLAAGRLSVQKGFDTLLAAAAQWRERQPEPLLVIAGEGPLAGKLAGQARELGVAARFLGSRHDVHALLAVADVFVLPSRWEGQPLILQEALQAGRPIVATDAGGIPDLTGADAALLVPPGDPAALGAAVLQVLDDHDLAGRLAAAAQARAEALPSAADAVTAALVVYGRLTAARSQHG